MSKYSVRFVQEDGEFVVVQSVNKALNEIVFRTTDESTALAWIQCTEYESDMDLYNEFG